MAVLDDVKAIIAEEMDVPAESVKESSNFETDFQADSLTVVEVIMALEDKFEIDIPEEQLEKLKTVGDLVKHIEGALAA